MQGTHAELLQSTHAEHPGRALMQSTCAELLQSTPAEHLCRALMQSTTAEHYCRAAPVRQEGLQAELLQSIPAELLLTRGLLQSCC